MPGTPEGDDRRDGGADATVQVEGKDKTGQSTSASQKEKDKDKRSPRGGFHRKPGRRIMKEYPLTQGELWGLGGVSFAATVFFSFGSFCLSTAFELYKDLSLDTGITQSLSGYWHGMMSAFIWGGIIFCVLGFVFIGINGLALYRIIKDTVHD